MFCSRDSVEINSEDAHRWCPTMGIKPRILASCQPTTLSATYFTVVLCAEVDSSLFASMHLLLKVLQAVALLALALPMAGADEPDLITTYAANDKRGDKELEARRDFLGYWKGNDNTCEQKPSEYVCLAWYSYADHCQIHHGSAMDGSRHCLALSIAVEIKTIAKSP